MDKEPVNNPKDIREFLSTAQDRFKMAAESETMIRKDSLDDLQFRAGDQWPTNVQNQRTVDQRPCLTINRLPQFIRQVTNDARHNRPSCKVSPVDDGADQDIADVINGMIRHIEVSSDAEIAYDTAVDSQVTMGFGYFRVIAEYVSEMSFEQEIRIKRIKNPFTVYFDPGAIEPCYEDANWAFITADLTKQDYRLQFPDSELASLSDYRSLGDGYRDWINADSMRIAEYFVKEYKKVTLYRLPTGKVVTELPDGMPFVDKRTSQIPIIKWYKINAVEILEEREWPGKYIPIIPVLGDDLDIDGNRKLIGMVRFAKDPQRMLNYWTTATTEAIALAPKSPFIIAEGQVEGYEDFWQNANVKAQSFLPYKPTSIEGRPVPPPQRNTAEPPVQAMMEAMAQAGQNLKDTTGIYDASLGSKSNETSGKAILARQKEGDISNFHYIDNLSRSIRYLGRILVDLIPKIYDTQRVMRIIGEDGSQKTVEINKPVKHPLTNAVMRVENDITVGQYDVTVDVGPSYNTKRQESAQSMLDLVQSFPAMMEIAGDLMVKNLDWPGATEISERLKAMLPPQIQAQMQQEEGGPPPIPPQIQAQMQQMQMVIQQLQSQLAEASNTLATKKMETDSRERIADLQAQVDLIKIEATLNAQAAQQIMSAEFASIAKNEDALHNHMAAQMQPQSDQNAIDNMAR